MRIALVNAKFKFLRQVLGEHLFYKNSSSANYLLHKEAIMAVVKYHIFNVQKITKNEKKYMAANSPLFSVGNQAR